MTEPADLAAGSVIWQQMYDPLAPTHDSSLSERIVAGQPYGPRFITRVQRISVTERGTHRVITHDGTLRSHPAYSGHGISITESNWATYELAAEEGGELF